MTGRMGAIPIPPAALLHSITMAYMAWRLTASHLAAASVPQQREL